MSLKIIETKGDLLKSNATFICHQTNCLGIMGGGIALQVKNQYPEVFKTYKDVCSSFGWQFCLGKCQIINKVTGESVILRDNSLTRNEFFSKDAKYICNCFGQNGIGNNVRQTDYNALKHSFEHLINLVKDYYDEISIAIPYKIGCGLAGGDWEIVLPMIIETLESMSELYNKDIVLEIVEYSAA